MGLVRASSQVRFPNLPNKILLDLWEGVWRSSSLPHVNLSLVHLKCTWPVICRHLLQPNWTTCGNILGIFLGILFLLTGLYGCLVSIPVSLYPKFACLIKWSERNIFLIRTPFWVKQVALGSYHWDSCGCLGFEWFWALFIFEQISAPNLDSDHTTICAKFWAYYCTHVCFHFWIRVCIQVYIDYCIYFSSHGQVYHFFT